MKRIFFCSALVLGLMGAVQANAAGYCPTGNCGLTNGNWQPAAQFHNSNYGYAPYGYRYSSNTGIVPSGYSAGGKCYGGNCYGGNCYGGNCSTGNCYGGNCSTGNCASGNCNSNFYGGQYRYLGAYRPYPSRSVSTYNSQLYSNSWNSPMWNSPRLYNRPYSY